jgi:hypothetical protein
VDVAATTVLATGSSYVGIVVGDLFTIDVLALAP